MKRIVYLICILIAATACKEVFEVPPQALLKASVLNSATKKELKSTITLHGIGKDSLLYKEASLSEVLFPLSTKDTSKFLISFDSTVDTITFIHQTLVAYASMESGFYNEYKLKKIGFSRNRIESILITDSVVTKTWHENIKVYIRPLPSGGN